MPVGVSEVLGVIPRIPGFILMPVLLHLIEDTHSKWYARAQRLGMWLTRAPRTSGWYLRSLRKLMDLFRSSDFLVQALEIRCLALRREVLAAESAFRERMPSHIYVDDCRHWRRIAYESLVAVGANSAAQQFNPDALNRPDNGRSANPQPTSAVVPGGLPLPPPLSPIPSIVRTGSHSRVPGESLMLSAQVDGLHPDDRKELERLLARHESQSTGARLRREECERLAELIIELSPTEERIKGMVDIAGIVASAGYNSIAESCLLGARRVCTGYEDMVARCRLFRVLTFRLSMSPLRREFKTLCEGIFREAHSSARNAAILDRGRDDAERAELTELARYIEEDWHQGGRFGT